MALLPWGDLELCLRPFVELGTRQTNLFVPDPELGWRLRPGATTDWGGYRVQINANGLRGPLVPHARDGASLRVLYLGDSVTFGYKLQKVDHSFPYQAEPLLAKHFDTRVETINAGVGGYSPWQELAYLRREGIRYSPDLVVVGFVLNDVSEKMSLRAFGGSGAGSQLAASYQSSLDWLLQYSAVDHFARRLYARLRFGPDIGAGALQAEEPNIRHLLRDDPDQRVKEAGIPVALVVFPDLLQFPPSAKLDQPQRILVAHARSRDIPVLDLLPPMARSTRNDPRQWQHLFIDHDHLTAPGAELAARLLRAFLAQNCRELLPTHCP